MYIHISWDCHMNIKEYFFEMILSCVCGILYDQVCFFNFFSFFQISDTLFLFYSIKFIYFFKQLFIPVWIETIVSDHLKVFNTFIYFDIFFTLMTVVPPSNHLFVIFIFDDAVFSHGRSGSVSGNVVDAIINVIVIIVFFFLFGVDIKDVYKFLFWEKIKDLIHPSLSEFFTGNKRKVLHFIFLVSKASSQTRQWIWGFHFKSLPKVCKVKTEPKTILFLSFL